MPFMYVDQALEDVNIDPATGDISLTVNSETITKTAAELTAMMQAVGSTDHLWWNVVINLMCCGITPATLSNAVLVKQKLLSCQYKMCKSIT